MKWPNLSEWALRHQSLVMFLLIASLVGGGWSYFNLGQKEDPEFTFKLMVVRVFWPGASAAEIELQVTDKLERKLQETPHLDYLRSYSKPGESLIFVALAEAAPSREVPAIWYQVRKKLGDIRHTLPAGVQGPFFNDEFGDTYGSIYAFTADGFDYAELKRYVDRARADFLRVKSVNKVDLLGEQDEKIFIEFSTAKLASLSLDPLLIMDTLQKQNALMPAGVVHTETDRVYLRVSGEFRDIESIRNIGIRANNRSFRLGDIAEVRRGYVDPPAFKMHFNGKEAVGLAISMGKGGDVIQLGKDLKATVARLNREFPVGIEIHQVSDQPGVVGRSVGEFMKVLLEAVAIVLAVSFLSLGWRVGVVVALSIPLVLALTFASMYGFGIDLQRISLGALIIALGLLVDDAIIAVEMMALKLEQGWDRFRAATYAYTSTAFPMLTGTLITAAGFLPVGLAKSNAGEYTFSIFAVVTIALVLSWVVAVIFTPFIGYKLLPEMAGQGHGDEVYHTRFYTRFRATVDWCLRHRRLVIGATAGAFFISLGLFKFVEQQFFPASNRPELIADLWLPQGASFAATQAELKRFEARLIKHPDVANLTSYLGGGSPRFYLPLDQQLQNTNFAQVVIMTRNEKVRDNVLHAVRAMFEQEFPNVRGRVVRLENGPPVGYPVQFRVVGEDPARLKAVAASVAQIMRSSPHTQHVNMDWNEQLKVMRLEVDQDKARALGVNSRDLSAGLHTYLSGATVSEFREGDKTIDIVARVRVDERNQLGDLKDLKIHTAGGRYVPLSQIAYLSHTFEEPIIWRRNRQPSIAVRADIVDGVQAPVVSQSLMPQIEQLNATLPSGYRVEVGGTMESSDVAQNSIKAVMPLMLLVVLVLLMVQLQSFQKTLLVLLTAPLGLIGVVAILLIGRVPFGFVATLGVIALAGMIMRNSVILVDQIDQDIHAGAEPWHAIVEATVRRFRPIMLTAAAAILGMIPLTQSTFWGPMAWAIMGGLLVATVLTLLFLPALYAAWFRVDQPAEQSLRTT